MRATSEPEESQSIGAFDDRWVEQVQKSLEDSKITEALQELERLRLHISHTADRIDDTIARQVVSLGMRFSLVEQTRALADLLLETAQESVDVRKAAAWARTQRSQREVDGSRKSHELSEGIERLLGLLSELDAKDDSSTGVIKLLSSEERTRERVDVLGLLGMAYQRLYLDAAPRASVPRTADLEEARRYFWRAFEEGKRGTAFLEQGVRWLGLGAYHYRRIQQRGTGLDPATRDDAKRLLAEFERERSRNGGLRRPAEALCYSELLHALGRNSDAASALRDALELDGLDAAVVGHALKQFKDVWGLSSQRSPGTILLRPLEERYEHLQRPFERLESGDSLAPPIDTRPRGRSVDSDDERPAAGSSMFPFGQEFRGYSAQWLLAGLTHGRRIVRLQESRGTWVNAFAVEPTIMSGFPTVRVDGGPLLILPSTWRVGQQFPTDSLVLLTPQGDRCKIDSDRIIGAVGEGPMGAAMIQLERSEIEIEPFTPRLTPVEPGEPIQLVGYIVRGDPMEMRDWSSAAVAERAELAFSIGGRGLAEVELPEPVHPFADLVYEASSAVGSGGSPVFDHKWNVVGLHLGRVGPPTSAGAGAKFGVSLFRMREELLAPTRSASAQPVPLE